MQANASLKRLPLRLWLACAARQIPAAELSTGARCHKTHLNYELYLVPLSWARYFESEMLREVYDVEQRRRRCALSFRERSLEA